MQRQYLRPLQLVIVLSVHRGRDNGGQPSLLADMSVMQRVRVTYSALVPPALVGLIPLSLMFAPCVGFIPLFRPGLPCTVANMGVAKQLIV